MARGRDWNGLSNDWNRTAVIRYREEVFGIKSVVLIRMDEALVDIGVE